METKSLAEYNLLKERVLLFGNRPEDTIPYDDIAETQQHRDSVIHEALTDREKYCFSENQTWDFNTQIMSYIGITIHEQLSRSSISESQRFSLSYLLDMVISFIDTEDGVSARNLPQSERLSWNQSNRVISNLLHEKMGEALFSALSELPQNISYGESDYLSTLGSISNLHSQPASFFQWETLRDIIPSPTVVSDSDLSDHKEQRRLYGISTYDMDNPRAFICWITIQAALFFSHENQNTVPGRYDFATAEEDWRKDLIDFAYALYIFGFKPSPLTDDESELVRTQLNNYAVYMRSMND